MPNHRGLQLPIAEEASTIPLLNFSEQPHGLEFQDLEKAEKETSAEAKYNEFSNRYHLIEELVQP